MLKIEFGGHSVAGLKPTNDDAFSACLPENKWVQKFKGGVACIADGVSNSDQAKLASQKAVTYFINDYYSTPDSWDVRKAAGKVTASINSWLYSHGALSHTRTDSAVTTFDAVIIKSQTAHIIHVGDSRVYLFRNGCLNQLTRDHSRRRGSHDFLTRALGIDHRLNIDYIKEPVVIGDIFLLSTDGLHGFLSDKDIVKHLSQYQSQEKTISLETSSHHLVANALKQGSDDNTSCLLVEIKQLPIESLAEAQTKLMSLVIPPVLQTGNKIDQFEIKRILHSSQRSHVYLAEDLSQKGKRFVLKVPSENFADDTAYLEAFKREYWLGRKLNSEHIIKIFPQSNDTRFLYHICEFVEGKTLRQWMIDNPQPELDTVRNIAKEISIALRTLHRNSVIHRDLKPDNIMLDQDGNIKLIDLGGAYASAWEELSRVLQQDENHDDYPVGDVDYIAPEYLLTGMASKNSDRYSLGVIVYEMLSNTMPFSAVKSNRSFPTRLDQWRYKDLPLRTNKEPHPCWLNRVLKKAVNPNEQQRYSVLSELINDLYSPSNEMLKMDNSLPLMERDPLSFWKGLSTVLAIAVVVLLLIRVP